MSLAVLADGRIVLGGWSYRDNGPGAALVAIMHNGSGQPDPRFGSDGVFAQSTIIPSGGALAFPNLALIQGGVLWAWAWSWCPWTGRSCWSLVKLEASQPFRRPASRSARMIAQGTLS